MAQILKAETKVKILEAATNEFLEKGYKDASLRSIAFKSHMTVGNLYRYFDSKEDLLNQIVSETLSLIDNMLASMTNNNLSFLNNRTNIKLTEEEMIDTLDDITEQMMDIYSNHQDEFIILMMDSEVNKKLTDWFTNVIKVLIKNNYKFVGFDKEFNILAHSYAVSLFNGVKDLLNNTDLDKKKMKLLIKIYFRSYVFMLNSDIKKMLRSL